MPQEELQLDLADLQQEQVMVDAVAPAVRVGHCAEYVVQALEGFPLRQRVRAQEHLHLPVGPGSGVGSTSEQGPHSKPSPTL